MTGIKLLAYKGAPEHLFTSGKTLICQLFPDNKFDFNTTDPDILFFISGGSEREALNFSTSDKFILLAAFEENNAYAAATEVKALFDSIGKNCWLADIKNERDCDMIRNFIDAGHAIQKLRGTRLGLIGEVSDWLIASDVSAAKLESKLGITLVNVPWINVADYRKLKPDEDFLNTYRPDKNLNTGDAGRVHKALAEIISRYQLNAITVECFSLVKADSVTACLGLSRLCDGGIPAGCEGDLASITGMMIIKEMTGIIPWMANIIKVNSNSAKFAHCTAPVSLLSDFSVDTHYETGLGTAINGSFKSDNVTVFRMNNTLEKAFLTQGIVTSRPKSKNACRTQIEVEIKKEDASLLKNKPLGNHHIIIPGHHYTRIALLCKRLGLDVINEND